MPSDKKEKVEEYLETKVELELRQLCRVYPVETNNNNLNEIDGTLSGSSISIVDFVELGISFDSGAIYGGSNGAILLGGQYTLLLLSRSQLYHLWVSFDALDAVTGILLWDLMRGHQALNKKMVGNGAQQPVMSLVHTTSSAQWCSHLPTTNALNLGLENKDTFVEGAGG